ncbi:MAG TPA: hypothetical protein VGH66_15105 [Acidimicrobiales bacterium]
MSIDQLPVVAGLEVVVMHTQTIEQVKGREVRRGPVDPVVGLQMGLRRAALGGTAGIQPLEGGLLVGVRSSAEVSDAGDGMGPREDGTDKGISNVIRSRTTETATGP